MSALNKRVRMVEERLIPALHKEPMCIVINVVSDATRDTQPVRLTSGDVTIERATGEEYEDFMARVHDYTLNNTPTGENSMVWFNNGGAR